MSGAWRIRQGSWPAPIDSSAWTRSSPRGWSAGSVPRRIEPHCPTTCGARLVELYTDDVAALAKNHPDLEVDRWPNFASAVAP